MSLSELLLRSEGYRVPDVVNAIIFCGEFGTKENFEKYQSSPIVKRIGEEIVPLLIALPTLEHYEATILE